MGEAATREITEADALLLHREQQRRLEAVLEELARRAPEARADPDDGAALARRLGRRVLAQLAQLLAVTATPALGLAALGGEVGARLLPRAPGDLRTPLAPGPATIIILNYQGEELLRRNLPSVLRAVEQTGEAHEILVVDNGSTDGSIALLRREFPTVRLLPLGKNYFFSAGNNAGVRVASHDLIVLLNNDMRVDPGFLPPLLQPFFQDGDVFAVASQIFFSNPLKRRQETGLTTGSFSDGRLRLAHAPVPTRLEPEPLPTFWAGGGACAFDRRKYRALGGLDVLFDPFYCEDADLSLRAWQSGWRVLFAPASRVHHEHRSTSSRVFGEKFVNEIFRRNVFLLHWSNLRDARMFAEHLVYLPKMVGEQVRSEGWSGLKSFGRALVRSPRAFGRRLRARRPGLADRAILELAEAVGTADGVRPRKRLAPSAPLNLVVMTPYRFHPVSHGGAVFTYQLVRGLAERGHGVSIVGFVDEEEELSQAGHLRDFCREVHLQVRRSTPVRSDPLSLTPETTGEFDRPALRQKLDEVVARLDPDVLHLEYTQMASYARASFRRINSISEHDVAFVSAYRRAMGARSLRERTSLYLEYLRLFHFEMKMLRRFDLIFTVNPREAALLSAFDAGLPLARTSFAGLDLSRFVRPAVPVGERSGLLFVGAFRHRPNVDALLHFSREILPNIHRVFPEARLIVAGAGAPPEVLALGRNPRIEIRGFVEDLLPLYDSAAAFISPIRTGAGIRVKLLEALAAGVPVVSTRLGAEGLDVVDGREIFLADDPQEFAGKVARLLGDPEVGAGMATRGREFVRRFDSSGVVEGMEEEFRRALRSKQLVN